MHIHTTDERNKRILGCHGDLPCLFAKHDYAPAKDTNVGFVQDSMHDYGSMGLLL